MILTRRRSISAVYIEDDKSSSSSSSVEVPPPKRLKVSTRRRSRTKSITNKSPSTSRLVKVAPPKKKQVLTLTTSGGTFTLPDGWTVASTGQKYKVFKETATGKKFYSKPQVLNYLGIADSSSNSNKRKVKVAPPRKELEVSTISTTPSEIPKDLYDLIQNAAKAREFLKWNPDNRSAKKELEDYELKIHIIAAFYSCDTDELPDDWIYDPETSSMAHVSKPPPPPKPKTQEEEKNEEEEKKKRKKKKEIKITWSSPNYHGSYPLNDDYAKDVWNEFIKKDTAEARDHLSYPIDKFLNMVDKDHKVVDLLGRFAVYTFNRYCQMYVNKDEANQVSGAEFMECKFYKLPETYIFYMTMEAIEQGIPGVYETKVQFDTDDGAMTLMNFKLTDREPKWNRPWVKPRELEVEYETVQDGSSDPQDFYELTGLVHMDRDETKGGGFNYHNPRCSTHRIICNLSEDKKSRDFVPNLSQPLWTVDVSQN